MPRYQLSTDLPAGVQLELINEERLGGRVELCRVWDIHAEPEAIGQCQGRGATALVEEQVRDACVDLGDVKGCRGEVDAVVDVEWASSDLGNPRSALYYRIGQGDGSATQEQDRAP